MDRVQVVIEEEKRLESFHCIKDDKYKAPDDHDIWKHFKSITCDFRTNSVRLHGKTRPCECAKKRVTVSSPSTPHDDVKSGEYTVEHAYDAMIATHKAMCTRGCYRISPVFHTKADKERDLKRKLEITSTKSISNASFLIHF